MPSCQISLVPTHSFVVNTDAKFISLHKLPTRYVEGRRCTPVAVFGMALGECGTDFINLRGPPLKNSATMQQQAAPYLPTHRASTEKRPAVPASPEGTYGVFYASLES